MEFAISISGKLCNGAIIPHAAITEVPHLASPGQVSCPLSLGRTAAVGLAGLPQGRIWEESCG